MHWDRLHAWNLTAIPTTCSQEGLYPRSLLQSQKKTFNMTIMATYSPSLFAWPCEIPSMNLAITSNTGPRLSDLATSTFFLCHSWSRTLLERGGCTNTTNTMYKTHKILYLGVQQRKTIQLLEEWRSGWYNQSIPMVTAACSSNSFPDPVVVEWEF